MPFRISAFLLVMLTTGTITTAQESFETFHAIRLESTSDPNMKVTLAPPTTGTPYQLTFPSTLPTADPSRRYAFSRPAGSTNGGLSWYATPYGAAGQVSFFESSEELIGTTEFQWLNTDKTLSLTSTTNKPLLKLSKTASGLTAADTMFALSSTYASNGQNAINVALMNMSANGVSLANGSTVTGLNINVTQGPSATANPSRSTGLQINVTGADTNRAAIIKGGFVGVNTDYPKVYLDVDGDVAHRQYNYTAGSLPTGGNNCDFDGKGNRFSFLRIASALGNMVELSGFAGGTDGKMLKVYNTTGQTIKVKNLGGSSSSANQIKTSANADLLLLPGNTYEFLYSAADQKWLVAFSGPSELANYGTQTVGPVANNATLPASIANYLQVTTTNGANNAVYTLALSDGTTPGQILVVQNNGPQDVKFDGTNIELSTRSSTLKDDGAMVLIWSGSQWVQVALANN